VRLACRASRVSEMLYRRPADGRNRRLSGAGDSRALR
jgi:hypothetical protein